jgi:EAL domain-containing protein (putative c-di-GMP-specific phosphodiesterase class I)
VTVANLQLNVEIRCGIAEWRNCVPAEDLLRQAGVALVEAKGRSSGSVLYQPGHDAELNRRVTLVAELRRAIVNDTLTLAYQPLLAVASREPVMLEALLRWSHPTLGDVSPAEFVPLAERAAVIADLSRWVLTAAIRQMGQWRRTGLEVHVAVNLSAADMVDPLLPLRVLTLLQEHHVPATQLLLEVTESTIMREPALAAQFMERLRVSGLRFGIDDFGTGYSSLASLHALPVDELKLDRAFIQNLDRNATNQAIVRAVTTLAHTMNLKVVAEGVETPEVWAQLEQLGCDIAQGYFISRPMSADAVPAWLRSQRALVLPAPAETPGVVALRPRAVERPGS